MSDNLMSMDGLDDILALVHEELEGGASGDRVKAIAEANPQARDEIFAFAEAWFASDGSDLSDDTLGIGQTVSKHDTLLDRFWKLADAGSEDPFKNADIGDLERIAAASRIDTSILRLIVRRFVDEMTIPSKLIVLLAEATGAHVKDVWSFLTAVPTVVTADYFAPAGRRSGSRISFAEAIRNSDLTPADKQFWLAHLGI
jgi:hypothetical protein